MILCLVLPCTMMLPPDAFNLSIYRANKNCEICCSTNNYGEEMKDIECNCVGISNKEPCDSMLYCESCIPDNVFYTNIKCTALLHVHYQNMIHTSSTTSHILPCTTLAAISNSTSTAKNSTSNVLVPPIIPTEVTLSTTELESLATSLTVSLSSTEIGTAFVTITSTEPTTATTESPTTSLTVVEPTTATTESPTTSLTVVEPTTATTESPTTSLTVVEPTTATTESPTTSLTVILSTTITTTAVIILLSVILIISICGILSKRKVHHNIPTNGKYDIEICLVV